MTLDEVKGYFGTSYQFNKKTGMKHTNYINWEKWGFIPIKTQIKLEDISNGELKASLKDLPKESCDS